MEIIVGSEAYRVHRVIMAAKSDYFRAVMSSQLKEAKENRVIIEDVDPEIMKTVIEFCYTNQVSLNDDNMDQLLSAAFRFCMESLKKLCVRFIGPRITASNCTRLIHSFQQQGPKQLLDMAIGFSLENFDLVCKTTNFSDIEEDIWEILLLDERLNLPESGIFRALVKWTEHDLENRKAAFERLVKHVRFATIDASELSELCSLELVTVSESCKELIAKAKSYSETENQDKQSEGEPVPDVSATPRRNLKNLQRMYAIGGRGCDLSDSPDSSVHHYDTLSSVEIYDPNTDKWTQAAPMQSPRMNFGCAVLGDYIYVAGGLSNGRYLYTFERYSIAKNTWQSLPNVLRPRIDLELVELDGYLYAIGGSLSGSVDWVERFCPGEAKWHDCAPMHIERCNAAYVALGGYIYAIGGDGSDFFMRTTLERYDPKTNSWCVLSPLLRSIKRFECTTYSGKIYVMCWGQDSRTDPRLFVYSPARDRWFVSPKAPSNRCIRFVEFGRQLYGFGGLTEDSVLNFVESYNQETKQWTRRAGVMSKRTRYGLIIHPQRDFPDTHILCSLVTELNEKHTVPYPSLGD